MGSLSVEDLTSVDEQTIESDSVAAAELGEGSERGRGVYREVESQVEVLDWHLALVRNVIAT